MEWMEFITVGLLLCTGGPAVGAGGESPALYVTEGDDVTLPCKNVLYPNCSSTTWNYNDWSNESVDELVAHGKIKDPQRHRRLSFLTNCSLHINNVGAEDAGLYTCRQFNINGQKHGNDTAAFLSVLTVRKLQFGGTVILQCLLCTYYGPGRCPPYLALRWINGTDPPGQRDPSSQTHTDRCISTLLINHPGTEKDQRKWRCQLLDKGEVKLTSRPEQDRGKTAGNKQRPTEKTPTAISVTVCLSSTKHQYSPEDNSDHKGTTLKTPTHTGSHTNHTNPTTVGTATGAGLLPGIGAAAAVFGAVCLAAVVMVTYRRRADRG